MHSTPKLLWPLALLCGIDTAQPDRRVNHGMIGLGIEMYNPACAYTCGSMSAMFKIDCRGHDHGDDDDDHDHGDYVSPSPECLATNDPYLQTAAWCIDTHCRDSPLSRLEWYWDTDMVARARVQPKPKYSYREALARARAAPPPTAVAPADRHLDGTSLVNETAFVASRDANHHYGLAEATTARYGVALLATSAGIPIALSWAAAWVPLPPRARARLYGWLVDPPVFGRRHSVPLLGLGVVPTRGQALFIGYLWAANLGLSAAGYPIVWPHAWYRSVGEQVAAYVGNRTGQLSLVNLALAVLFSSRNSPLLWLTGWSYSTLLLLHRWVAVIAVLQAAAHSLLYLALYVRQGRYEADSREPYWAWGVAGTVLLAALVPLSALPLRRRLYEAFLAAHVALSVLVGAACVLHIYHLYQWMWGFENWVWIAAAFWASDRLLARPWRLARNGVRRRALVTVVDDDYLRVDIPGCREGGHVYLYFPTLTWRVWENHPFSVAALSHPIPPDQQRAGGTPSSPSPRDAEADDAAPKPEDDSLLPPTTRLGASIYLRRRGGLTAALAHAADNQRSLPVLVEGPYGAAHMSLCPAPLAGPPSSSSSSSSSAEYPSLICFAGGVGIAAALPLVRAAPPPRPGGGATTRLFWGVRTLPLVASVMELVGEDPADLPPPPPAPGAGAVRSMVWGHVDVAVSVGERFDVVEVLDDVLRESRASGGATVMVCGPPGMADDVRVAVAAAARKGAVVRLLEESFSW